MSNDSDKLQELEDLISDRLFLKVQNWNLYLGDAGLSRPLAIECQANIDKGANVAARKGCESVEVRLGAEMKVPLSQLLPSGQIFELEDILNTCFD